MLCVGCRFNGARYVACTASGRRIEAKSASLEAVDADVREEWCSCRGRLATEGDNLSRFKECASERGHDGLAIVSVVERLSIDGTAAVEGQDRDQKGY